MITRSDGRLASAVVPDNLVPGFAAVTRPDCNSVFNLRLVPSQGVISIHSSERDRRDPGQPSYASDCPPSDATPQRYLDCITTCDLPTAIEKGSWSKIKSLFR